MFDFNEFLQSSQRIFNVSRKPDLKEYRTIAKVTAIGIIIIGVIGFLVKLFLEGIVKI